jgi:hypothetical protein
LLLRFRSLAPGTPALPPPSERTLSRRSPEVPDGGPRDHKLVECVTVTGGHGERLRLNRDEPRIEGVVVIAAEEEAVSGIKAASGLDGD